MDELFQFPQFMISATVAPKVFIFEEAAALVEWAVNLLVSIPQLPKTVFSHLPIVHGFTDLWGFMKLKKNFVSEFASLQGFVLSM